MRRLFVLAAAAAVAFSTGFGQASAASNSPNQNAGSESESLFAAQSWFTDQRAAPNDYTNPSAFSAVQAQAASLPVTGGAWTERTNPSAGDGVDFSDSPQYIDPTSNFSNSGAGDRYVGGRMTSLAAAPDGSLYAGAADGGVWKSTNGGTTWTPETDSAGTLSIGALLVVSGSAGHYTVYAGTGEANTSSDSYAGIGVIASSDGGATWARAGNDALTGALVFRLAQDGTNILAATSHGLYRLSGGTWTAILQPGGTVAPGGNFNLNVGNMITDVQVVPGTGGANILAVAGWRGGAPTNGLYLSTDGGTSFTYLSAPAGYPTNANEGRTTLAFSANGDRLYAVIQSPYLLNVGTNGKTLLQGVYESANGDPNGPWIQVAQSEQLANSGSAQNFKRIGTKTYSPGIQAWYNQFLAVDPANHDHVYLGLEEVYESTNGGGKWNTIAPYWNFGFSCFSYSPFEGTCNHNQAHSDQHAALIANGKVYIGNDGGVYAKSLSDHTVGNWADLNAHVDALQYYAATGSADNIIYGGLQDNGSNKVFPTTGVVRDDNGNNITVSSVQVFGGDGGYTLVDPANSNNVITEYTGLTALKSTDGGANWQFIVPADPNPRFISPIAMDRTNSNHLLAGGAIVWNSETGIAGTTSWQNILDMRTATGRANAQVTALDGVTIGGVQYVAAAWCGACNASFATGGGFHSGIAFLKSTDNGATWTLTANVVSNSSSSTAIARRYIAGVRIDTANPSHAYVALSGYSRKWMIGPSDPGVGHVFETNDGGNTWANISGDPVANPTTSLPDVPMDDVVFENNKLVVATDFGTFTSSNDGASWSRFGTGLPNVVVDQLTQDPNGNLVAATHGRGIWTIAAP